MGCNESKHDVVTGNTVPKNAPARKKSNVSVQKSGKDLEVIQELSDKSSAVHQQQDQQQQQQPEQLNKSDNEATGTAVKDITVNTDELKEVNNNNFGDETVDGKKEDVVVVNKLENEVPQRHGHHVRSISSPDRYFSSRKDHEEHALIEAIVSSIAENEDEDGIDQVEYHSPRKSAGTSENDDEEKENVMLKNEPDLVKDGEDKKIDGGHDQNDKSTDPTKDQVLTEESKVTTTVIEAKEESSLTRQESKTN